jgi:hypothetical protein
MLVIWSFRQNMERLWCGGFEPAKSGRGTQRSAPVWLGYNATENPVFRGQPGQPFMPGNRPNLMDHSVTYCLAIEGVPCGSATGTHLTGHKYALTSLYQKLYQNSIIGDVGSLSK